MHSSLRPLRPLRPVLSFSDRIIRALTHAGTEDMAEDRRKSIIDMNTLAAITGAMTFVFGTVFHILHPTPRIIVPVIIEGCAFFSLILLNKLGQYGLANKGMYVIHGFSACYFGPTLAEGLPREWVIVFLVVYLIGAALLVYKKMDERIFCFVMIFLTVGLYEANDHYRIVTPIHFDADVRWIVALGCKGGMLILISYVIFHYMLQNDRTVQEKDALLLDKDQLLEEKEELVQALERADHYRTQFLLETSHELRVPLTAAIGNAQLLSFRKSNFQHLAEHEEIVSEINQVYAANYLTREIINNILDIAKVESGKMELQLGTVDLKELIEDSIGMNVIIANLRKVAIHLNADDKLPLIKGDRVVLIKIINNLLSNAVKFTRKNSCVELTTSINKKDIRVRVSNHSALSRERAAKIFDSFESQRSESVDGTGLGLTITRRLVEDLLKGRIWVETDEVTTTSFCISIPFVPATADTGTREDDLAYTKYDFSGKKVMLIEDNEMNLNLLSKFMSKMGAVAVCYDNVEDSLEAMDSVRPDIIISDNQMPVLGGRELLLRLKSSAAHKSIPVIILSGDTSKESTKDLLEAGASAYVLKPVLYKDLQKVMYGCLCDMPILGINE